MKSAFLISTAALAMGGAAGTPNAILNHTDAVSLQRELAMLPSVTFRLQGVDIVGLDTVNRGRDTPDECFRFCVTTAPELGDRPQTCSAATWTNVNGGTCYAKNAGYKGPSTTPKAGAESFFITNTDRTFIWSTTKDGLDMPGNDLTDLEGKDMPKCMDLCNGNAKCYAVTWTNYKGGTCWLKSRASAYVPKAGAKTAYVARKFNGPQ